MAPVCLQNFAPPSVSAKRQKPDPISPLQSHVCPFIHQTFLTLFLQWNSSSRVSKALADGTIGFLEWVNLCTCDFICNFSKCPVVLLLIQGFSEKSNLVGIYEIVELYYIFFNPSPTLFELLFK